MVIRHHKVPESIVTDRGLLFTSKFWSLLYYFLKIKKKLSTIFYSQTNGHTEKQNSTMKAYLRVFINWKQNNWARLLAMAEFAYINAKNASIGNTPFELNCGYHLKVLFEENVDPHSKSHSIDKLAKKLRGQIEVFYQNLLYA